MLFQKEEPILYHSIFLINIKNSPGVITSISKEAKSLIFLVTIQSIPAIFAELNCKDSSPISSLTYHRFHLLPLPICLAFFSSVQAIHI